MTFEHNPRGLWAPPLLELGVMPWQMDSFTPRELTEIGEWLKQLDKAKRRKAASGGVG